jgi:hypothetical protein
MALSETVNVLNVSCRRLFAGDGRRPHHAGDGDRHPLGGPEARGRRPDYVREGQTSSKVGVI